MLWVGLPAIRGPKGTADMLFLDSLYREGAAKAGITYVDVWDGFVDEAGRFLQKGPDFEGQIRQLRSYDGVYFTKPGARKLAHYVEREITPPARRTLRPDCAAERACDPRHQCRARQARAAAAGGTDRAAGCGLDLGTDQLLGGPGSRPAAVDALAAKTMVKGEPLAAPAGRADDYAWPRREVGREQAKGDTPVAATTPDGRLRRARPPRSRRQSSRRRSRRSAAAATGPGNAVDSAISSALALRSHRRVNCAPAPRHPNPAIPRPPGNVGRSAEMFR